LGWAAGFGVAVLVGEPNHGTCIAYVHELRIRAGRIEGDAKRLVQTGREVKGTLGLAVDSDASEHLDDSRIAFGHKEISIGSAADEPGIL
jgi:tetrahydromethanopterin S-methyltransferase subunit F